MKTMDNQELADAIVATHGMLKNTLQKTPVYEDLENHLKYLLEVQAAKAGMIEQSPKEMVNA